MTSATFITTVWRQFALNKNYQIIELNISVVDEMGEPLPMASILIFNLTEKGSVRIVTGHTNELGCCSIILRIYRLHVGWTNVMLSKGEKETFNKVPIFVAHNIIVVVHKYPYHVVRAIPLDPTFMKWPIDEIELRIVARHVFAERSVIESKPLSTSITHPTSPTAQSLEYILIDSYNNWAYTNVVVFATWYNISAHAKWYVGNKYEVETKNRVSYDGANWKPWLSAGSTQITIDRDLKTRSFTENSKVIVKFEYEYRIERYHVIDWETGEEWYEDWAFAIDHTAGVLDPRGYDKVVTTWNGTKKGGNYVEISQETENNVPIKGGIKQMSLLGVKIMAIYGYVHYAVGTWYSGYKAYIYDANTNWLEMYAIWRTRP